MKKIIFQGDSITDACRDRNNSHQTWFGNGAGMGYANYIMSEIGIKYPNQFEMLNLGIGGNRIVDLYARIKSDCINHKPDYLTILIGVNDVWHEYDFQNGIDEEKYFTLYSMYIDEVKAALPDIKIYIIEPFVLPGIATSNKDGMIEKVKSMAKMAKKVAQKYNLPFITMQDKFDALCEIAEPSYWLCDGVHPTIFGYRMMATEILKVLEKDLKKI